MTSLASHIQRQIERYADGELSRQEAQEIEALLQTHEGARNYLRSIEQVRMATQTAIEDLSPSVDFDALEDAIMQAVEKDAHARRKAQYAQISQWVDNELQDAQEQQRVFAILAEDPNARQTVEAIREIGHFTREYVRLSSAQVDFEALEARCLAPWDAQQDVVTQPAPAAGAEITPFKQWLQRFQAPLAAAAGIAAATAILLPLSLGSLRGDGNPLTSIDEMNVDAGYSGTITHGTRKSAPVIWISDDQEVAPARQKEPIHPVHEDTPEEEDEETDLR